MSIASQAVDASAVLTPHGVLDSSTYRSLRDDIVTAALEEPNAVIVDVTELEVPAESAWTVLTSARWHVSRWPGVPIVVVCQHAAGRSTIARIGVTRCVPVYSTLQAACNAVSRAGRRPGRRRARASLPVQVSSLRRARDLVTEWLTEWSHAELIPVAHVIVTALVENVLQHTDSRPDVLLESDGSAVTVAVEDASHVPASLRDEPTEAPSGLRIVSALCRAWGSAPTISGKTVWAILGPENRL
jgi:anti-anti-sigma regulatory factor